MEWCKGRKGRTSPSPLWGGRAEERKSGRAEERKSGRAEERKSGRAEERKSGRTEERKSGRAEEPAPHFALAEGKGKGRA